MGNWRGSTANLARRFKSEKLKLMRLHLLRTN
jgi:hypothetical protein